LAAKKVDISRHRSTTNERSPRSQIQIDTDRHAECNYGSAVGFSESAFKALACSVSVGTILCSRADSLYTKICIG
jgi:hypothetical protein